MSATVVRSSLRRYFLAEISALHFCIALTTSNVRTSEPRGLPCRTQPRSAVPTHLVFSSLLISQLQWLTPSAKPGPVSRNTSDAPADDPEPRAQPGIPRVIGGWRSAALGDTGLFHIRGGRLQAAFPLDQGYSFNTSLDQGYSFNTSPALLGSCDSDPEVIANHVRFAEGTMGEGDDFFVCTDAMAAWFLACVEDGGGPWEALRDFTEIGFAEWVSEARRTGGLHNDDVPLVHVDIW